MPGDVVRRMIKGKDTQRGYCRYINMRANVQIIGTNFVIPNVKSRDLVPLEVSESHKLSRSFVIYTHSATMNV
jgi:hypothetical protein